NAIGSTPADASAANSLWTFHRLRFSQERGGAQMFTYDVDADGDQDVISAVHAHEWGLAWYENESADGESTYQERLIMGNREQLATYKVAFTQPHALALADIDGDGLQDIITGKRRWAHGPKGDIEPNADPVVYWFQLQRKADGSVKYVPHLIDDNSGVGVQIAAQDVNNDGQVDVLTSSKLGSFVFLNAGE
ncbi:MAG: VCBS repeat-containing protein, partial [Fuerstiella sp.]|nr:VCBS repeat-containing protein [Fuerstiella sp.]